MGSEQRETILVFADRFNRTRPALDVVALVALCSHLATVNVGVAVGALSADVGKHGARVALGTRDLLVHSSEWKTGGVVIELRGVANRFPTGKRVAVLAGKGKRSVRTASCNRFVLGALRARAVLNRRGRDQQDHANSKQDRNHAVCKSRTQASVFRISTDVNFVLHVRYKPISPQPESYLRADWPT